MQAGATTLETARTPAWAERLAAASLAYGFTTPSPTTSAPSSPCCTSSATPSTSTPCASWATPTSPRHTVPALAGTQPRHPTALLDRAAELGLLTDYGGGYYGIHPALPWFFTDLYTTTSAPRTRRVTAERAYTHAYATLGHHYFDQVERGRAADWLPSLRAEEANLPHALNLARTHHLPNTLGCAQGLDQLYDLTGRTTEWARLVADIQGDFLDPATDQPHPGREDAYSIITEYRVRIARAAGLAHRTRLQTTATAWVRGDRAAGHLDNLPLDRARRPAAAAGCATSPPASTSSASSWAIQDDPACRDHLQAAYELAARIGDTPGQAAAAGEHRQRLPVGDRAAGSRPGPALAPTQPRPQTRTGPDRSRRDLRQPRQRRLRPLPRRS